MLPKCLGRENLEPTFRVAPKSIWGRAMYGLFVQQEKTHYRRLWHHRRMAWNLIHDTEKKGRT